MANGNVWVDILVDENDGLNVFDDNHHWLATGCSQDSLSHVLDRLNEMYPNAMISMWFDDNHQGLRQHLAETNRSL